MSPSQNTFSKTSHAHGKSVDRREMENFADIADAWWDPNGKFRPLHAMNGCRIRYLKEQICQHFHCDPDTQLKGLCLLDIGCGGGLLTEPMARLGAQVTGIDALEKNVRIAKNHAEEMGLEIEYRFTTAEDMVRTSSGFDVVLIMEVIEHVINPSEFIASCTENVRPGGLIFFSTINRTLKAFWLAIFGAEYVMRWLPAGTHQYEKFITPGELGRMLTDTGLMPHPATGMIYNPLKGSWRTGSDTSVNYILSAEKPSDK